LFKRVHVNIHHLWSWALFYDPSTLRKEQGLICLGDLSHLV
jgi:hypothetical protein